MHLRIYGLGLLIVTIVFFSACKPKKTSYQPTLTIVEGTITSAEYPVITLSGESEIKSNIDPAGNFIIQTELTKPGIYRLEISNQFTHVFIVPGDRITVQGDFRNMKSGSQFKGDHANENNFLVSLEQVKSNLPFGGYEAFYGQTEQAFIQAVEERSNALVAEIQGYQKKNEPFDDVFLDMINDEISYDAAIMKLNYPNLHKYFTSSDTFTVSDTYESFLQNIDIDSDENLFLPSYPEFLNVYLSYKIQDEDSGSTDHYSLRKYKAIDALFQQPLVKSKLYFDVMNELFSVSVNDAFALLDDYLQKQSNDKYREQIQFTANEWANLRKGMPAPEWSGRDRNGKVINSKNYAGKVVYLDIWATWCGPCIQEIPHLDDLHEQFKGEDDIVFISISIDQDIAAWRNYLSQKNLKGIQLFAEGNWSSSLVSAFNIRGIPRFIIIGKNGTIVDATAPRPSTGMVVKRSLEQALQL
jgi:thiol-disulfide isomerase/thioredoxin